MNKIRSKILLFTFLGFGLCSLIAYQLYSTYETLEDNRKQYLQAELISYKLLAAANSPFYNSLRRRLEVEYGKITPEYRSTAYNKILGAYRRKDRAGLNKHITFFRKQDTRYKEFLSSNLSVYESRMYSLGVGFIISFTSTLFILMFLVFTRTLKPLNKLSRRMLDFLNNRYSYQFRVPPSNEVGELELNFHSLAQRVINNIEELKALDSAKSDFLNIASHELRTPLTSIKGSLNILNLSIDSLTPDKVNQLVSIAESEADRLIRLINDLLDLAKIEAGHMELEKKWVRVDDLIERTLFSLEGFAQASNVKLAYTSGQAKIVDIDQDKTQQVITNLASNAIKYSPEDGTVTIEVSIDGNNHLKISVIDQGEGISPEEQKNIFEKFRQVSGKKKPIVKGTGLGLAIARAVVEEHGGNIGVQSKVDEGSSFYFTLPKWRQDRVTVNFKKSEDENTKQNKKSSKKSDLNEDQEKDSKGSEAA